jgi:hypothetical protein
MKPTRLRRPYPSEIAATTRQARAWFPLLFAFAILASLVLFGCDATASTPATTAIDADTTQTVPTTSGHLLEVCAIGRPADPTCASCSPDPFRWDIDIALSTDTTISLPLDTLQCRAIGRFPDTTRFEVEGFGGSGELVHRWFRLDGDSIPFRWDGRVNRDSILATSWDEN